MKFAAAFFSAVITAWICSKLPIHEVLGLAIVLLVFFIVLGFADAIGPILKEIQQEENAKRLPSTQTRVLDPVGVVLRKRQPVRVLGDKHPSDHGEITSIGSSGVVVRFPDSSFATFPVRLHRDDRNLHVEGIEVDPVAVAL